MAGKRTKSRRTRKARPKKPAASSRYWFDEEAAADAVCFIEEFCVFITGEWGGQPFKLAPWQKHHIRQIFGWKRKSDNLRRYRVVWWYTPRKSGKSEIAAAVALYLLGFDKEPAAQVVAAANDKEQARIVWGKAAAMAEASPVLRQVYQVTHSTSYILHQKSMSSFYALSSEIKNKDGLNIHGLIIDEIHEWTDRRFYAKLMTARGSRRQPLVFITTTAGDDIHSLCYELYDHAKRVLSGEIQDDTFYPVIYEATREEDWKSEAVWRKANPNYPVTPKADAMREAFNAALLMPLQENDFRRYHLNQWTSQKVRWLSTDAWEKCGEGFDPPAGRVRRAFLGLDLSSVNDMTALVTVLPWPGDVEGFDVMARFYLPAENLELAERRSKVPLKAWAERGLITLTDGNVIDYEYIKNDIKALDLVVSIESIGVDPYNATQISNDLLGEGYPVVLVRQGYANVSPAAKELQRLVLAHQLRHGGNPVLAWHASNVAVRSDSHGNIAPCKQKSAEKIDGISALVTALSRALEGRDAGSAYEDRGITII